MRVIYTSMNKKIFVVFIFLLMGVLFSKNIYTNSIKIKNNIIINNSKMIIELYPSSDFNKIAIFIYSDVGKIVQVIRSYGFLNMKEILLWRGKNKNNNNVNSGLYFIYFITDNSSFMEKVIVSDK